jgi:hypothetical protein
LRESKLAGVRDDVPRPAGRRFFELAQRPFCPASIKVRTSTRKTKAADLIANIRSPRTSPQDQRRQLDLLAALNRRHQATRRDDANLEARIQSFELAYRMQMEATDALDISQETKATQELYKADTVHGRQLLIARRLIERGVRVVQCYHGDVQPWDSHNNLAAEHRKLGNECDGPIASRSPISLGADCLTRPL